MCMLVSCRAPLFTYLSVTFSTPVIISTLHKVSSQHTGRVSQHIVSRSVDIVALLLVLCRAGGSVDTEMDRLHLHVDTPCAKSASKKSVFGSLERSMDKLLCMLTPKKKRSFDEPRSVKVCAPVSIGWMNVKQTSESEGG